MKSSSFSIKPVVTYHSKQNVWTCRWVDPTRTGRYAKHPYFGFGSTSTEAMEKCRAQYLMISLADTHSELMIRQTKLDVQQTMRDKPWWKRWWHGR